ncbi:MAG: hypothetical protein HOP25_08845 [Methylotenera sp.]|nr:hypothetical protein [Methylotenera sp.]
MLNQLQLNPRKITFTLGAIAFFLVVASLIGYAIKIYTGHKLLGLFDLDLENNFPTFYSMCLLLIALILLAVITLLEKKRASSHVSYWATLTFGFLLMSLDEVIVLHERLNHFVRSLFGGELASIFHFSWVILGIAVVILLGFYFLKFLLQLPKKVRRNFILSASVYLAGAIGMELLGGWQAELHGFNNLTFLTFVTIEETLEMAGVIIFIHGLFEYIADNFSEVQFIIKAS